MSTRDELRRPTSEEVARVRAEECRWRGHDWDILRVAGLEDPVALVCANCGRRCKVTTA